MLKKSSRAGGGQGDWCAGCKKRAIGEVSAKAHMSAANVTPKPHIK